MIFIILWLFKSLSRIWYGDN